MIEQLISTFCRIDDFCIVYENALKNKLIGSNIPKRGPNQSVRLSEIMTILIMHQLLQYRNFKSFYNDFVCEYWKPYFPMLPSYGRFIELIPQALVALSEFTQYNHGKHTGIYYVDATKLPVCHNLREHRHKVFDGLAGKSKTSTGWFYGLKLHFVINHLAEVVSLRVTKGNVDDRTPLVAMCKDLTGYVFGDRGYISKDKQSTLAKQGLKLVTTLKKNMKNVARSRAEKSLLRNRGMIETMIDYLKNSLMLWHTRHRSPVNALTHLMACMAAWVIAPTEIIGQRRIAMQ
jgi:hypothetical protein